MNKDKKKVLRLIVIIEVIVILLIINFYLITLLDDKFGTNDTVQIKTQSETLVKNETTETPKKKKSLSAEAKKVAKTEKKQTLLLVNSKHEIPEDYEVKLSTYKKKGKQVATAILDPLEKMIEAGEKKGLSFAICSGYRSISYQEKLFNRDVETYQNQGLSYEEAVEKTSESVQPPKCSEHATGYAVDIVSKENSNLDETQEETEEFKWLKKHCYEYGFILRYPDEKKKITGITFEPWHFRYVGKKVAKFITKNNLTLEEFTELVNKK